MKLTKNTNMVEKEVVQKVMVEGEPTYTLELTLQEAKYLCAILGKVAGPGNCFPETLWGKMQKDPALCYSDNPYYEGTIYQR